MAENSIFCWRRDLISTIFIIIIAIIVVNWKSSDFESTTGKFEQFEAKSVEKESKLRYCITNFDGTGKHMATFRTVFGRLGHVEVNEADDFDLMWSYRYVINSPEEFLEKMKPHQKFNYFPFISFLTAKSHLAAFVQSKYIPKGFLLPDHYQHLQHYAQENPEKRFVIKSVANREVEMIDVDDLVDLEFDESAYFIQEYVENPLLVDGKKFDVGIYIVITSVDPLRLYMFDGEILVRFCPEDYHPFDPDNVDKYVIYETQKNIWTVESTAEYFAMSGSLKKSLEAYLESYGYDVRRMWEQIEDAIVEVVTTQEQHIVTKLKESNFYEVKGQFFQLLRCDFIFDENLNAYLMEINFSPNLTPTAERFLNHQLGYLQVVYNTLNLVGFGAFPKELPGRNGDEAEMIVASKDTTIKLEYCRVNCTEVNCDEKYCKFCHICISEDTKKDLLDATWEQFHKGNMKRIFPSQKFYNEQELDKLSPKNQMMTQWYQLKCAESSNWC